MIGRKLVEPPITSSSNGKATVAEQGDGDGRYQRLAKITTEYVGMRRCGRRSAQGAGRQSAVVFDRTAWDLLLADASGDKATVVLGETEADTQLRAVEKI
jgi:hypothetical protein